MSVVVNPPEDDEESWVGLPLPSKGDSRRPVAFCLKSAEANQGSHEHGSTYSTYLPYVLIFRSQQGANPLKVLARPRGIEPRFSP